MEICNLKGRDCIEKNSLRTFDCNTTCVGIYADVQFVKKNMRDVSFKKGIEPTETEVKEKLDEGSNMLLNRIIQLENMVYGYDTSSFKDFKEKLDEGSSMLLKRQHDILRSGVPQQINDELTKRGVGENGRELDKEKYNALIAEYMKFKARHVKHFRFNSGANSSAFGETESSPV